MSKPMSIYNKINYVLVFFIVMGLMFIFKKATVQIAFSTIYLIINCIIFVILLLLFVIYLIKWIIHKSKNATKKDMVLIVTVFLFAILMVFIFFEKGLQGRYSILHWMLGNIFLKEIFQKTLVEDPRTYSMVLYAILQQFGFSVTPFTVIFFNKIYMVLHIFTAYFLSKVIFKNKIIPFLVIITYVTSSFIRLNFNTIEFVVGGLFFAYASIYFMITYMKDKNKETFILACLAGILAAYYRYELAIFFGIPFVAFYNIFIKKNKSNRLFMKITIFILLFCTLAVAKYFIVYDDPNMVGIELKERTISNYLINALNILENNILYEKDLLLSNGLVSLFTYVGITISLILTFFVIYSILKGKKIKGLPVYLIAFYTLFYFICQISLHIEGLRTASKYSVNYILGGIILSYFAILWVIDRTQILPKFMRFIRQNRKLESPIFGVFPVLIKIIVLILFFYIALISSPALSIPDKNIDLSDPNDITVVQLETLTENIVYDYKCFVLKVDPWQPKLDYFFSSQKKALFLGRAPEYYENLDNLEKQGNCYYYLQEYDLELWEYHYSILNESRIDLILSDCQKSVLFEDESNYRFKLKRYDC